MSLTDIDNSANKKIIFLCGPPGSGKSTIGKLLATKYGLDFISSGDIVRKIINENGVLKEKIKKYVDKGELVDSSLMEEIMIPVLQNKKQGYILDGYPVSKEDNDVLIKFKIFPDIVFYFDCTDDTSIKRQIIRNERITDAKECATKRVTIFRQNIPSYTSLLDYYSNIISINVNNDSIQNIFSTIDGIFYDQCTKN